MLIQKSISTQIHTMIFHVDSICLKIISMDVSQRFGEVLFGPASHYYGDRPHSFALFGVYDNTEVIFAKLALAF